jgi:spore germination protein KC
VKRRRLLLAALCAAALLLTGCTPYKEIKELSIVQSMGVDGSSKGGYRLSFQVLKTKESAGGGGSSSDKSGGSGGAQLFVSSGETLFDAMRNTTLQTGRKLYFSNNQVYIFGESACRDNIETIMDFMQRVPQIKPQTCVYMTRGEAQQVITSSNNGNPLEGKDIADISDGYFNTSKTVQIKLFDVFKAIADDEDIILPVITSTTDAKDTQILRMDGAGVFSRNRLAGYLTPSQVRGYLWVVGKADGGIIVIRPADGQKLSMEVVAQQSKITPCLDEKGRLAVRVEISVHTNIQEIEGNYQITLGSKKQLTDLERKVVTQEAQAALNQALRVYKADIFNFSEKIYGRYPEKWQEAMKNRDTFLTSLPVYLSVEVYQDQKGLITK